MSLAPDVRYAGFWRRLAASMIDIVILMPVLMLLLYLMYGATYFEWLAERTDPLAVYGAGDAVISNLLPIVLMAYFWMHYLGTPGKLLLGCHVVDAKSGVALNLRQIIFRNVGYLVSLFTFGLGFLWIAKDVRKQGFHDKIAGSVVILVETIGKKTV
ncbi:RDD domain-containing protein [Gammaproteobacteria bacterium]